MRAGLIIYGDIETVSGGYLYDRMLVDHLRRQGDRVDILSLPPGGYLRHLGDNFSSAFLQKLAEGQWDVLLQDELNHPSLFIVNAFVKKRTRFPLVGIVHHLRCCEPSPLWLQRLVRGIEAHYLNTLDGIIFNSAATRARVSELLRKKVPSLVAYPGRDLQEAPVMAEAVRERIGSSVPLRILFLGNVIRRKGLHVLINALTALRELPWHLDIAGDLALDRGYVNTVLSTIVSRKLVDRVSFYGTVPSEELKDMMAKTHLLAVPSLYEGLGIAYMEALARGIPVIGTSAGGAHEVIAHGRNGFLVNPGDAAGLARILARIARDRQLLLTLSLNAADSLHCFPVWEESMESVRHFIAQDILRLPVDRLQKRAPSREEALIS